MANDILNETEPEFLPAKEAWTPQAFGRAASSPYGESISTHLTGFSVTPTSHFGGIPEKTATCFRQPAGAMTCARASMFSLLTPPMVKTGDGEASANFSEMAPKLNAQTLFSFGVSGAV